MHTKDISLTPLKKAHASLARALHHPKDELLRDATILRFEHTFDLSWKSIKRYLEANSGIQEFNIKNIFKHYR